jgi:hypothetical protein
MSPRVRSVGANQSVPPVCRGCWAWGRTCPSRACSWPSRRATRCASTVPHCSPVVCVVPCASPHRSVCVPWSARYAGPQDGEAAAERAARQGALQGGLQEVPAAAAQGLHPAAGGPGGARDRRLLNEDGDGRDGRVCEQSGAGVPGVLGRGRGGRCRLLQPAARCGGRGALSGA